MQKLTTSEVIKKRKRNRRSCTILLDPDIKHEIEKLTNEIAEMVEDQKQGKGKSLAENDVTTMRKKLAELYETAKENSVEYTFQDLGARAFRELMREHPPGEETLKIHERLGEDPPDFEPDTFAPMLIHRAAVDPEISLEEAQEIYDTWNEDDIETMFWTAFIACRERTSIPFSEAGIAQIGSTEPSSTTGSTTALDGSNGNGTSTS